MQFKKATRSGKKARVALIGSPGAGKTYTAITIAQRLAPGSVAVIDTERGSASKYAGADSLGDFDALELTTYRPQVYIDALKAAAKAGYQCVIVDSLSHAWEGTGGALDQADAKGGRFDSWKEITPQMRSLIDAILAYPGHVIVTLRTKVEYIVEEDSRGKKVPRKIGLAPKFKEGLEYEFDVVAMLEDATLRVAKSRCSALAGYFARDPGPEFATLLSAWLAGAESAAPSVDDAVDEELIDRLASMSQTERRDAYMSASAATQAAMKAWQQRQREAV